MGLLKKFQGYRSDLSNTLQRAETIISEQASYMGKDNLHRLIEKVNAMDCETIHTAHSDFQLFFCALLFCVRETACHPLVIVLIAVFYVTAQISLKFKV